MKRILTGLILTSALVATPAVTGAANAAPAKAPVAKKAVAPMAQLAINIDGKDIVLPAVNVSGYNLVNVRELTKHLGLAVNWNAKTSNVELKKDDTLVTFSSTSKSIQVNGKAVEMIVAPQNINGTTFIQLAPVVQAFGGETSYDAAAKKVTVSMVKLLDGTNEFPRFVDANTVIVSRSTDESKVDYLIDVKTKKAAPAVTGDVAAAEMVISPDGKTAAFADENGQVYLVDLATKQATKLGSDTSIKTELTWAPTGDKLYFLKSDKTNVIAAIDTKEGKVTDIVKDREKDKVDYKSDLRLSKDGSTVLYTIQKGGKITADSVKEDDEKSVEDAKIEVDNNGTESQLFMVDLADKDLKQVQLTKDKDNKVFGSFLADGRIVYVSADVETEGKLPVLKVVSKDGKETKDLVSNTNIFQVIVTTDGKILMLAADKEGKNKAIFEVDAATGAKKQITTVAEEVDQMYTVDGKNIAVTVSSEAGERVAVLSGSKLVYLTK